MVKTKSLDQETATARILKHDAEIRLLKLVVCALLEQIPAAERARLASMIPELAMRDGPLGFNLAMASAVASMTGTVAREWVKELVTIPTASRRPETTG